MHCTNYVLVCTFLSLSSGRNDLLRTNNDNNVLGCSNASNTITGGIRYDNAAIFTNSASRSEEVVSDAGLSAQLGSLSLVLLLKDCFVQVVPAIWIFLEELNKTDFLKSGRT